MHILVTGANGFVGRALCDYLTRNGHDVRRAVRVQDGLKNTVEINGLTSPKQVGSALDGVECVIHLAGRAHVLGRDNPDNEAAYKETNTYFSRRLALLAHAAGVRRFVFISSIKVCGEESRNGPLTEESIPSPVDVYAISKWEAEQALRKIEKETGLEVVIVRPPLVYGEDVKANFLRLLSAVYHGFPLPFALLTNKRSFVYLQNLASALSACATHPRAAGETFHISDNEPLTLPDLLGELAHAMGHKARTFPSPKWLLQLLGKITGKQQQIGSLVNELVVDGSHIRRTLGWSPLFSFPQGIQKTVDWYLSGTVKDQIAFTEKAGLKVCQLCAVDFTLKHLLLPLVRGMQEKGWNVISVCSNGPYVAELRQQGYKHFPINISRNIFDVFSHVRSVWALYRYFRHERFDVLHVHTPIAALLGRIAGRLAGIPLIVYTAHGFYFHDEMPSFKYRFYVLVERLSGYWTDLLFTQSSEDAQVAVTEGIADKSRVLDIGNGVNAELFTPATDELKLRTRMDLGIPADAFVVGTVSRLVREKGLVEFLEAAVELGKTFPKAHFILVGERLSSDHGVSVDQELQAAQKQLGSRLVAVGYHADVAELLGAMNVFCLPSYREGMPRSIIEAMMMALPVVATNIRGSREEVMAEETGLLIPTRNSAALVQALGRLIADPDLSRRMGESGRKRALELYDERRVVAQQIGKIAERRARV